MGLPTACALQATLPDGGALVGDVVLPCPATLVVPHPPPAQPPAGLQTPSCCPRRCLRDHAEVIDAASPVRAPVWIPYSSERCCRPPRITAHGAACSQQGCPALPTSSLPLCPWDHSPAFIPPPEPLAQSPPASTTPSPVHPSHGALSDT